MKSKKTKLLSVLCVLVLCVAVGLTATMAKYLTTGTGSDSASVAKFGVKVTIESDLGLFNTTYKSGEKVIATASANIVAPGTSGELASVTIEGTPEVNVKVSYTVAVDFGDNWTLENNSEYMPLVIKVGSTEYKLDDTYDTIAKLETAISTAVSNEYEAGATLTNLSNLVSWSWVFEGNSDANDTYLANKTDVPSISVTVTATVEQIETLTQQGA